MLTLPLEPTDDSANPLFRDAGSCTQWLSQLQLTNLHRAHGLLLTQIREFNRFPMRGSERLKTLELLRDTVHYVQNDYSKKLISLPLPLSDSELTIFVSLVQLWQAMALGYQRCLQDYIEAGKQPDKRGALLCQRCLLYCGLATSEHLRAGYEIDAKLWQQLHGLYAYAERNALQLIPISDPLNGDAPNSSCQNSYVKTLLTCYARTPELTRSQLQMLDTWLSEWSDEVRIQRSYTISKGADAQPLALDLEGTQGLLPIRLVTQKGKLRYLAMVPLSKLLRIKTILLLQGQTPQQLKLGNQSSTLDCIQLLTFLHQCWCEGNNTRFDERSPSTLHVQLCQQRDPIYALLSGTELKPAAVTDSTAKQHIAAAGLVLPDSADRAHPESGPLLEQWTLENKSILGAKLIRTDLLGGRLSHNQLLALRIGDAKTFTLGVTTWVSVTRAGQLRTGVRFLPGNIQAVTLKIADASLSEPETAVAGFLLQAIPALKSPASLILPNNRFKPDGELEIRYQSGEKLRAKMGFSVERGIDYERVSFTVV